MQPNDPLSFSVSLIRFKWEMIGVLLLSIKAAGISSTLALQGGIVDITAADCKQKAKNAVFWSILVVLLMV